MRSLLRFSALLTILILTACSQTPDSNSDKDKKEKLNSLRNSVVENETNENQEKTQMDPKNVRDTVYLTSTPVSNVVMAGEYFETIVEVKRNFPVDIFVEFIGKGEFIEINRLSSKFKVLASPGFPSGKTEKEQSYKVIAKIPLTDGSMRELSYEGKFTVRKP
jgi:protein involved in sex pheromone biosynthesis